MDSYNFTLSDGRNVKVINRSGVDECYEVQVVDGPFLGVIWYGIDEGTQDEALKPFEKELLEFVWGLNTLDL